MLTRADVDKLERLAGQLEAHHKEISALAKRSPVDAVNEFKLRFINVTLKETNVLLGESNKPLPGFDSFDSDEVRSNSDVTFVLASYLQAAEKFRADNIYREGGAWWYQTTDTGEKIRTGPPAKLKD